MTVTLVKEFGGVLPRAVAGLRSSDWSPVSLRAPGQLFEVVLDQMALSGMSLIGRRALPARLPHTVYAAAAQELSALGIDGVYADPPPLSIHTLKPSRIGRLAFERLTFEHDPVLPPSLVTERLSSPVMAGAYLLRHRDGIRPWVVWVHGAGQGQPMDLLFSRAARLHHTLGFNVVLPIQPGHGFRRNAWPTYPEREPLANVAGMIRAVSEVRAIVQWINSDAKAVAVLGVSMGSPVVALVSHLEKTVDAVAVYTPILGLNTMIAQHLARGGPASEALRPLLLSDEVVAMTSVIDPLSVEPAPPPERRLIVGAWNDQMATRAPAIALHERWGGELYWYDGSHVGHLFSSRIQEVTERFLLAALTA